MSLPALAELQPEVATPTVDSTILDTREFEYEDGNDTVKVDYNFLVIDSAEKWKPAKNISGYFDITTSGAKKSFRIILTGISYKAYEAIELANPIPDPPENDLGNPNFDDKEYIKEKDAVVFTRKLALIEASSGMAVPGENQEQKIEFLKRRCGGEIETLVTYIIS